MIPSMALMEPRREDERMRRRAIERCSLALRRAGILPMAVLAMSCAQILGIEELTQSPIDASPQDAAPKDAGPSDFAVRGTAVGVLGPVALELRLGSGVELLAVTQDGTFEFEKRLENGDPYTVVVAEPTLPCTLRNQTGVVAGADTAVELTCTGASLASVVLSGIAPTVTLVPGIIEYMVDLPLSQPSVTVTATLATAGDTLAIGGTSVASGAPSAEITLSLGDNPVEILVENDLGWQRAYHLTLRRAGQLAQYAYGKASNTGASDNFGIILALSGDTLAIGAPQEASAARGVNGNQADNAAGSSGAVYVFRRAGALWQQEAYIKASNTGADDLFGQSVSLSGDTLAVGAAQEDSMATGVNGNQVDNAAADSGAVYVFRRTGATWQQEAYIKASNTGILDNFGVNVALAGDTLAVGAYQEDSSATGVNGTQADNSAPDSGAVYVFRRTGATWQQEAYVKASNTGAFNFFGISTALAGDTLAVGAILEDSATKGVNGDQADNSAPGSGAVYVFRRVGTVWQQESYLKASNTNEFDNFGIRVALSGDTLAVGAHSEASAATGVDGDQADNSAEYSGAVYVFHRAGTTWQQEAYLKAFNTGPSDYFGISVALSGDILAVGANEEDSSANGVGSDQADESTANSGAAYLFRRTGTTWQQDVYIKASNTGRDDHFGSSVALSGDTLAVGAASEASAATGINGKQDDNDAAQSGAVYVFH
jgi:trimeric autotransporter adhesin